MASSRLPSEAELGEPVRPVVGSLRPLEERGEMERETETVTTCESMQLLMTACDGARGISAG